MPLLLLIIASSVALADAVLTPPPAPSNPGFIDAILASRGVIASIRVAIVFATAYVIASTVWLIANRRFLVRVGSVEVDAASPLDADNKIPSEAVQTYQEEIAALERQVAEIGRKIPPSRHREREEDS